MPRLTLLIIVAIALPACDGARDFATVPHHDPPPAPTAPPTAPPPHQVPIEDLDRRPVRVAADEALLGAFRPLDGKWRGRFHVYVDTRGQQAMPVEPADLDPAAWQQPPFRRTATLEVEQEYTSEDDAFQRVVIRDRLPDGTVAVSRGVNKIQDGRLWCVVRKPDDLVIHPGELVGPATPTSCTIIWRRDRAEPKAIEFFREVVGPQTYTIVGWGKYGDDDPAKGPRMYFSATYRRVAPASD